MASKVMVGQCGKVQQNDFQQETARISLYPLFCFLKSRAPRALFGGGTIGRCLKVVNHNGRKFAN